MMFHHAQGLGDENTKIQLLILILVFYTQKTFHDL